MTLLVRLQQMMNARNSRSSRAPIPPRSPRKDNIFSQPWNESDLVLAVEGEEFHVHRSILSFQSPVFKAMFNGNFKDARQDKIKLKDENYEAMLQFLQLLYPPNTLHAYAEVIINDENIFKILDVADKYGAMNVIIQCMKETGRLKPENAMRLLPYAVRHELPREEIFDVLNRHISTEKLGNFAPELGNDSVYTEMLKKKCHFLEILAMRLIESKYYMHMNWSPGTKSEAFTDDLRTLSTNIVNSLHSS